MPSPPAEQRDELTALVLDHHILRLAVVSFAEACKERACMARRRTQHVSLRVLKSSINHFTALLDVHSMSGSSTSNKS
jgi:hypothetical protein